MDILAFVEINRVVVVMSGAFTITALWPFFKINKKKGAGRPQLKITGNKFFYFNKPFAKVNGDTDRISKYFSIEKEIAKFDKLINEFLAVKKPFLRKKYSVIDLAADLNVPTHYLSGFINRYYNINYNDLVNKYRVSYCEMMMTTGGWEHKKLEAIASDAGFSNRNTFTTAFKKETGKSPSDYLKEVREKNNGSKFLLNGKKKSSF